MLKELKNLNKLNSSPGKCKLSKCDTRKNKNLKWSINYEGKIKQTTKQGSFQTFKKQITPCYINHIMKI